MELRFCTRNFASFNSVEEKKGYAPGEARTHGLQIMRLTRCLLRYRGLVMERADRRNYKHEPFYFVQTKTIFLFLGFKIDELSQFKAIESILSDHTKRFSDHLIF